MTRRKGSVCSASGAISISVTSASRKRSSQPKRRSQMPGSDPIGPGVLDRRTLLETAVAGLAGLIFGSETPNATGQEQAADKLTDRLARLETAVLTGEE